MGKYTLGMFMLGLVLSWSAPVLAEGSPPSGKDFYKDLNLVSPAVAVRTSADLNEIDSDAALETFLYSNRKMMGDAPAVSLTYQQAVQKIESLIDVKRNKAYLDLLRKHPLLQTPEQLTNLSVAQLTAGLNAQALASLLVAQQRWPNDAVTQFNIAGLLSNEGFAAQSQAVLGEIRKRGTLPDIGSGITSQAGIDYLDGFNKMRMGQYAEASEKLNEALKAAPDMAETALSLALVEAEMGRPAKKLFLQGYYRRSVKMMQTDQSANYDMMGDEESRPEQEQEDIQEDDLVGNVALPVIHYVDISKGQPGLLPYIPRPESLDDALAYSRWLAAAFQGQQAKIQALDARRQALSDKWRKNIKPGPRMEWHEEILRIYSEANARLPELRPLVAAREESDTRLMDAEGVLWVRFQEKGAVIARRHQKEPPEAACPDMLELVAETHAKLMGDVKQVDVDTRRAYYLWHRYATALGALSSDADFHAYLKSDVELADEVEYQGLLYNMLRATAYSDVTESCRQLEQKARDEAKLEEAKVAPCDQKDKMTTGYTVGPFKLDRSCEGISLGAEVDLEFVKIGAETHFDKDGWVEGHKVGGEIGGGGTKFTGEVTTDKGGGFKEGKVGVEIGVGVTTKNELGYNSKGDMTIYSGTKYGGEVSVGPAKGGISVEEGSGYTVHNGEVTSTFTQTVTRGSAGAGGVGVSRSITTTVPGPAMNRGG